jgi:hypothetical protein
VSSLLCARMKFPNGKKSVFANLGRHLASPRAAIQTLPGRSIAAQEEKRRQRGRQKPALRSQAIVPAQNAHEVCCRPRKQQQEKSTRKEDALSKMNPRGTNNSVVI